MFWLRSRLQELAQELAGDESVDPEAIKQGEAAMAEAEANHPRPALKYLSECFNLSLFEEKILLLCVAMEQLPLAHPTRLPTLSRTLKG